VEEDREQDGERQGSLGHGRARRYRPMTRFGSQVTSGGKTVIRSSTT